MGKTPRRSAVFFVLLFGIGAAARADSTPDYCSKPLDYNRPLLVVDGMGSDDASAEADADQKASMELEAQSQLCSAQGKSFTHCDPVILLRSHAPMYSVRVAVAYDCE